MVDDCIRPFKPEYLNPMILYAQCSPISTLVFLAGAEVEDSVLLG